MKFSCLLTPSTPAWLACAALLCSAPVLAQPDAGALAQRMQARDQERAHVQGLRGQLEQRRTEAEKNCWERFAVEDCLREVRAQAREQDNQLRDRELRINSEERHDKAQERLRSIESKQLEKRSPAPVQVQSRSSAPAAPAPQALPAPAQPAAAPVPAPVDVQAAQASRDAAARERAQAQALRLQQHEAEQSQRTQAQDQRRERVKKSMEERQQAAQERRARKADDIARRTGQPLPIPEGLQAQ